MVLPQSELLPSGDSGAALIEEDRMREELVTSLANEIIGRRKAAITGRKELGFEETYNEDLEYYNGIDDLNRSSARLSKSAALGGPLARDSQVDSSRCTAFFNVTAQFCDAASSRCGDMLSPANTWNFAIHPTPVPSLIAHKDNPDPALSGGQPVIGPDGQPLTIGDYALAELKEASDKAEKAEQQIRDWLVECRYSVEFRRFVESAVITGTGVLKGPEVRVSTARAMSITESGVAMEEEIKRVPCSRFIDPLNLYPDPACGDDIQKGNYIFERDYITTRQLRSLIGDPGYDSKAIMQVIDEGPQKKNLDDLGRLQSTTADKDLFEIWYYHGMVDKATLEALGVKQEIISPNMMAIVTMVNDTPIKTAIDPCGCGEFPYDVLRWEAIHGVWYGRGVARKMRTGQDMVNASCRALMNNAGLASGPQLVLRRSAIDPADGEWNITPLKIWWASEEADVKSVADSILAIDIPMVQAELSNIIQQGYKFCEDSTGITFLLQGQQGSAPDTVGGMQLLHQNASALLRRMARMADECIESHINRYYKYLLLHGPEDCKGDFHIQALGSSALVEREIQHIFLAQMLNVSLNPAYGLDPEKTAEELIKANRMLPDKFKMDASKKQSLQPAPAPAVQAAQIREEGAMKRAELNAQVMEKRIQVDTDRDTAYVQALAEKDRTNAEQRQQELAVKRELELLKYANQQKISLDAVKAELAQTAMKLKVQKELSAADKAAEQTITPPTEPAGRAKPGHAFEE